MAIVGLGGVGLSALMSIKTLDCDPVIAIDISNDKLDMARRFGATHTINSSENDVISVVMDITKGKGVDHSIEAAGHTATIELAFEILNKSSGQCVFASHPPEGDKIWLSLKEECSAKYMNFGDHDETEVVDMVDFEK